MPLVTRQTWFIKFSIFFFNACARKLAVLNYSAKRKIYCFKEAEVAEVFSIDWLSRENRTILASLT